jgi:thiopeptide-type bacteriocin biosynthesis protein
MQKQVIRTFEIGSEWLYYKIYCSVDTAEGILSEKIYPVCKKLKQEDLISSFFFIRYGDPQFHLRLRIRLIDRNNLGLIIGRFYKSFKAQIIDESISKIQVDTYQREIERYGDKTMELAEELFYYDSVNILKFLKSNSVRSDGSDSRWLFGMTLIDHYLNIFNLDTKSRIDLLQKFRVGSRQHLDQQSISELYKSKKDIIFNSSWLSSGDRIIKQTVAYQKPIASAILNRMLMNTPQISLTELLSSFIHMSLNRLFVTNGNISEWVLYDFMYRYYSEMFHKRKS